MGRTINEYVLTYLWDRMARKKSEDKRIGILEAAAKAVAENGVSATTAQIA